jgi:hypothetical protein
VVPFSERIWEIIDAVTQGRWECQCGKHCLVATVEDGGYVLRCEGCGNLIYDEILGIDDSGVEIQGIYKKPEDMPVSWNL